MYCNGQFIITFIIFLLINMGTRIVSGVQSYTAIKKHPWQLATFNNAIFLKKQLTGDDNIRGRHNSIHKGLSQLTQTRSKKNKSKYSNIRFTKRSSIKDNLSEEYKKNIDKIDNCVTTEGDNQSLLSDYSEQNIPGWYKNNFFTPQLSNYNDDNNAKISQTKFLTKKDVDSVELLMQDIRSNQNILPPSVQTYDLNKRNAIKENMFEGFGNKMDIITNTLSALDKRNCKASSRHIFQKNNPLEPDKWLTSKKNLNNDFNEHIWQIPEPYKLPHSFTNWLHKRYSINPFIQSHPLDLNKWVATTKHQYHKNAFDENIWKPMPKPNDIRKRRKCYNIHSYHHPLNGNKQLSTNHDEYYTNNFDQNLWNIQPLELNKLKEDDSNSIPIHSWKLRSTPAKSLPLLARQFSYPVSIYPRQINPMKSTNANTKDVYPNVLTKAVEISMNPSNGAHIGGNLLSNIAKKMNTTTLELAEKIVNSVNVSNLAAINKDKTNEMNKDVINKMSAAYSKTVMTPKPIMVNNQPSTINIVPSILSQNAKNLNETVENNTNSNVKFDSTLNDETVNITTILDQVLEKLEAIQHNKVCEEGDEYTNPEGVPCDIAGLWSSQSLGLCFDIEISNHKYRDDTYEDKNHQLKIKVQECTPPRQHNILDLDWSFAGSTQKELGGPFFMYAYKQSERSLATFSGFCRTCFRTDTLYGLWTMVTPNKDCSDILLSFNSKPDILKRVRLESKQRERYKNLLLQQQLSKTKFV